MKKVLRYLDTGLAKIEDLAVILGFSLMFIVLLAQVFMRYFLNDPLTWSEECARFIFVWVSFVGISYAYRNGAHIRMEVIVNRLPARFRFYLEQGIRLATIVLFVFMIPFSFRFIGIQARVRATATHIPMSIVYIALPLGLALSAVRLALQFIASCMADNPKEAQP